MGIGEAIEWMREGKKVTRGGWNGKAMYVALEPPHVTSKMTQPFVYIKAVDGHLIPWNCSQADLLATDWQVY